MTQDVSNRTKSASQQVREFIRKRPFISNAIAENIVNYSSLSRLIQKEIGKVSIDAIKIALIREQKIIKQKGFSEKNVIRLLKNAQISLNDKTAVVISPRKLDIPYIVTSDLTTHHVYVVDQTKLDIKEREDTMITKNLVALVIKSKDDIENTPGFVAFISQLLAREGINIREFISCYVDTVLILSHNDAVKAFNLLQEYI